MFDVDDLIVRCREARDETEPRRAMREVLQRALSARGEIADALAPTEAGLNVLHREDDLTVIHVVWAPKMVLYPHDHRMWAAIGIYSGGEDNAFYRRAAPGASTLTASGGKQLSDGDTLVLGDDAIHSVTNPRSQLTGAIHVYGGDFVNEPRSRWEELTNEQPWEMEHARRQFAEANAAWRAAEPLA